MDENQDLELENDVAPCPECQSGVLHLRYLTYFTWLDSELITVPNFPSWVCDLCGRREYDTRAIRWLNAMLHPETGKKPKWNREQQFRQDGDIARPS